MRLHNRRARSVSIRGFLKTATVYYQRFSDNLSVPYGDSWHIAQSSQCLSVSVRLQSGKSSHGATGARGVSMSAFQKSALDYQRVSDSLSVPYGL